MFKCEKCEAPPFADSETLREHRRTHKGEKTFACGICGLRFARNGNLQAHMRKHTGEKLVQCSLCPYRTATTQSLSYHRRSAHGLGDTERSSTGRCESVVASEDPMFVCILLLCTSL